MSDVCYLRKEFNIIQPFCFVLLSVFFFVVVVVVVVVIIVFCFLFFFFFFMCNRRPKLNK